MNFFENAEEFIRENLDKICNDDKNLLNEYYHTSVAGDQRDIDDENPQKPASPWERDPDYVHLNSSAMDRIVALNVTPGDKEAGSILFINRPKKLFCFDRAGYYKDSDPFLPVSRKTPEEMQKFLDSPEMKSMKQVFYGKKLSDFKIKLVTFDTFIHKFQYKKGSTLEKNIAELGETEFGESSEDVENSNEKDNETTEESFHADSLKDFLQKTETKLSVKKEGSEPSPIFGPDDMRNHNKYRIKLENKNGSISFIFWDSIKNTENNVALDEDDALGAFGIDCSAYESSMSFEDFKSQFGYDKTDDNRAQKAYNGCRKQMEKAKKMFSEDEISELIRLSNER